MAGNAALVGVWHLVPEAKPATEHADLVIEPEGRMLYATLAGDKWQVMRLTYRLEGEFIVSNQPSAPREERTRYSLQSDGSLVLELGGERMVFRRGERRMPFLEQ